MANTSKKVKNPIRRENKILLIVFGALTVVAIILFIIFANTRTKILYMGVHGSDEKMNAVKILDNGEVFCSDDTEGIWHNNSWKLYKKISNQELEELKNMILYKPHDEVVRHIRDNIGCIDNYRD